MAVQYVPVWLPVTENWIYNQVVSLPDIVETHVVCKQTENLERFPSPRFYPLSEAPFWRNIWDRGLVKLGVRHHFGYLVEVSRSIGAQILHSHFGEFGWANLEAARQAGQKHVVTFYGYDVNFLPKSDPRWLSRYRDLFSQVDRILCEGSHMARCIVELGCPEEKMRLQHLGVRVADIPFQPRSWHPGEPLRVLLAASFREKKGLPYAIAALGRLHGEMPLEITIIGDAGQEESSRLEKVKILDAIEAANLRDQVRLLGYQPHEVLMTEAYRHHIFLSPSVTASDGDTEGGAPVTLIEMEASGMLVVSSRHCDIPEVIRDGVTGLLAEERDVAGLVTNLRWLVSHPECWPEMTMAGRQHIEREYDAVVQGKRLADIYRECLDR